MADTKTFTTRFDLLDNFSTKFAELYKKITSITNNPHVVGIDFETSAAGQALDNINKKVAETSNISNKVGGATEKTTQALGKTAEGAKKVGSETEKSTNAMDRMKSKLEGLGGFADKLKDKFGAITGLLTGGMVAGMSWLKAADSQSVTDSIYRKLDRKKIDTKELDAFVKGASGLGYTTGGQRLDIVDAIMSRTRLKGSKAESATEAIEKLYFQDNTYLSKKGISSSADLAELLTKKTLSRSEKQLLSDIGITGGSASSRLRSAERLSGNINPSDLVKGDPLAALNNRLGEFSKNMGKVMIEPMTRILEYVNKILDLINSIPGAPGLLAVGMVLVSMAGGASLLITALSPLIGVYTALKGAMLSQAAATVYASVVTKGAALAQWLLNAAMLASPFILIIIPLAVLAGALYLVEKKTHMFSNALKRLKSGEIGSDIKEFFTGVSDRISGVVGWVEKLYARLKATGLLRLIAGAAMGPMGIVAAAGSSDEIREKIWAGMMGLMRWVSTTFPFLAKIHDILKKVHSIFEWIYSLWQGFWGWIKSAMPGAAKESKRLEMEKLAEERSGLRFKASTGQFYNEFGVVKPPTGKLADLFQEYKDLPGFAEGIADAVAKGIGSIGDTIADKIKGIFPDFTPLVEALQRLQSKIAEWIGNDKTKYDGASPAFTGDLGNAFAREGGGYDVILSKDWNGYKAGDMPSEFLGSSEKTLISYGFKKTGSGNARGITFTKSGIYTGMFHGPEETLSQAATIKGPGVIARALDLLDNAGNGRSEVEFGGDIHVHNQNDFSGMKVSDGVDIAKLMARIDKQIEIKSILAVKNAIGQRRT